MARKPDLHSYSDRNAFERLLLLIATFVHYPGVGCPDLCREPSGQHHQALELVRDRLLKVGQHYNCSLPQYSVSTLRKDLETLRRYGILEHHMYRWGYYLGTGAMDREELQLALQALAAQAQYQGDSNARHAYQKLERRLRGLNLALDGQLFYPVRTSLNRAIVYTDPEEMMQQGQYRPTLFHQLQALETAILQGQAIELHRHSNPYGTADVGYLQVYPLQLIYVDVAWYLLFEHCQDQYLEIERVDRFRDHLRVTTKPQRNTKEQESSLTAAHHLLREGWGLYLGDREAQQKERQGEKTLTPVKVRFFPTVIPFILEGERRHPRQKIKLGPRDATGQPIYIDYSVSLPYRSFGEFSRWVYRFMPYVQVRSPKEMVKQHQQVIQQQLQLYEVSSPAS